MRFSLSHLFAALFAVQSVAAIPTNNTRAGHHWIRSDLADPEPCQVNAVARDTWEEWGLQRYRTTFSATGIDPAGYCDLWAYFDPGSNVQCGYEDQVDGGWWRVNVSVLKEVGEDQCWKMLVYTRYQWKASNGCVVGW
ncbi:hypothetical protein B0T16DRAFT_406084 [Cercophora newfieldiana]|uniref:Uncharacterized protein n=1 Tax=Cercophora newfieldiana TaxID=92897 RepID=A0AA40CUW7_9PEZI|nr:hypothetical protein B0T16DRAFT_406084 [Cercophora newfieldiana]